MKNSSIIGIIAASAALAVLAGCNKIESVKGPANGTADSSCELTVALGGAAAPSSKVASQTESNEKTIQNVQVFVFRAGSGADQGKLDVSASVGFDTPLGLSSGEFYDPSKLKIKCSTGEREIYVVVNDAVDHTRDAGIRTKAQFLALTTQLKDNTPSKLFMIGNIAGTLVEGTQKVTVPVKRVCAAIILEGVTNAFVSPAYQGDNVFRVGNCYLLNVPGKINFGLTSEPGALDEEDWYARLSAETASPRKDLIFDAVTAKTVNYTQTDNTTHTFYAYPNNCAFSEDLTWSRRATVLVVEAEINDGDGWTKYYYPVAIKDGLQSNKQYRINISVNRPGSLDPNQTVKFSDLEPDIVVSDWEEGTPYSPSI